MSFPGNGCVTTFFVQSGGQIRQQYNFRSWKKVMELKQRAKQNHSQHRFDECDEKIEQLSKEQRKYSELRSALIDIVTNTTGEDVYTWGDQRIIHWFGKQITDQITQAALLDEVNVCADCGRMPRDYPTKLCVVCNSYKEHLDRGLT